MILGTPRTLPYKTWGSGGYHFVSIAHSILVLDLQYFKNFKVIESCAIFIGGKGMGGEMQMI